MLVYSQLVCLPPVGILSLLCSFEIFVSFSLSGMSVNWLGVAKCMTTIKHTFDIFFFLTFSVNNYQRLSDF